jgi:hypothetical protein
LIASSAGNVLWAAASTKRGIAITTWLGMSPATGNLGLWKVFWWKNKEKGARDLHRWWIVARLDNLSLSDSVELCFCYPYR